MALCHPCHPNLTSPPYPPPVQFGRCRLWVAAEATPGSIVKRCDSAFPVTGRCRLTAVLLSKLRLTYHWQCLRLRVCQLTRPNRVALIELDPESACAGFLPTG